MGNSLTNSQSLGDSRPTLQQSFGEFYNSRKNELKLVDVSNADLILHSLSADHALKKLKLKEIVINSRQAAALKKALSQNSTLYAMYLQNCSISPKGGKDIAHSLTMNHTLKKLDLQHNNLGDMGTISIMGALTTNRTLLKLNLNNNFITNDSCESIAQMIIVNDTLKVLRLKHNMIENAGRISEGLAVNKALQGLHLGLNKISSEGIRMLCKSLENSNHSLKCLSIPCNPIRDENIGICLEQLLSNNRSLVTLDATDLISSTAAIHVAEGIKSNETLSCLLIGTKNSEGGVGNIGALAICKALRGNTSLKKLNIESYNISEDVIHKCLGLLQENTTIQELIVGKYQQHFETFLKRNIDLYQKSLPPKKKKKANRKLSEVVQE